MNLQRIMLLGAVALSAAACSGSTEPKINVPQNTAYVRYVHAVADTGLLEPRFVDQLEGSAYWGQVNFRTIAPYQMLSAGSRHLRIFPAGSTNINVVSQIVLDTTLSFTAGHYYTLLHTGYARAGATPKQGLVVLDDTRPTPGAQIAVRAVNASTSAPSLDVYSTADTSATATLPAAPLFDNLGPGKASAYVTQATGAFAFRSTADGSTTVLAMKTAPKGATAASSSQSNQGGFSIGGSILSAFYFPASVAGSSTNSTRPGNFTTPAIVWMQDNRP